MLVTRLGLIFPYTDSAVTGRKMSDRFEKFPSLFFFRYAQVPDDFRCNDCTLVTEKAGDGFIR